MSEQMSMAMLDDVIIPDEAEVQEPTTDIVEDPTPNDPPQDPEPQDPPIDTSLKGIDGEPIDADTQDDNKGEVYKTLAEALKEEGFFSTLESVDDITDLSKLADAFKSEIEKNEFSDLTESQRRVLEGFRNGIPEPVVVEHEKNMQQYNSIDDALLESNEELQKALLITDLMAKGISESRANKMYEISYDNGELLDEARSSLETLKQREAAIYQSKIAEVQAQREAQAKAIENQKKAIKKSIYDVDKFLDEVAVTENLKQKVHSTMTEIVGYTSDGQPLNAFMKARLENPVDFETKLYYLFELTDGFTNIKKFNKQAESKAAKKLESLINNNTFIKDNNSPAYKQDPNSYDAGGIVSLI
jgi:hypothetical protein